MRRFALDGNPQKAVLANDRFQIDETLDAPGSATKLAFTIPAARAADFPVGVYRVGASVQKTGEPAPRATNELALTLAPSIAGLPISCTAHRRNRELHAELHSRRARRPRTHGWCSARCEFAPQPFSADTTSLSFVIPDAPVGIHLARLRVDGIDSPIIDTAASPPAFLNRRIEIT